MLPWQLNHLQGEGRMAILDGLKLSNVQKSIRLSPIMMRRHKLVDKLHEQLMLAKAMAEGKDYEIAAVKRHKDRETGVIQKMETTRKVRPWWFVADSGKTMMQVKYGTKVLELAKGKISIEIASADKLIATIEQLKKAALDGELDGQIESALT